MKIRHKGLSAYWLKGNASKLTPALIEKVTDTLSVLEAASELRDTRVLTGWHQLTGDRKGVYAVTISRNWRVTFKWKDGEAVDVGYEDYH